MFENIRQLVDSGTLPHDDILIAELLTNADSTYLFQEGDCWDFKESWPFSYSDEYFQGLARLVCAFYNTDGGIIVFGVDDKFRKGGRTKTNPNVDRFEQAFFQLTGVRPEFHVRRYKKEACGDIDILHVKPKGPYDEPAVFLKDGAYPRHTYWVRRGSTVTEAEAQDITQLFLRQQEGALTQPLGYLPPNESYVRKFVGRMPTVAKVFSWLAAEDEPRTFLYGRGGSGKSTIAQEVFKNIKLSGGGYALGGSDLVEQVIFVTAKKTFLDSDRQKISSFSGNDFEDESGLYRAILILGDAAPDNLEDMSLTDLKTRVKEFLSETACFIVIDDIDTLTTAGEEGGLDFLYRCISRSKKISKVLYTLRNIPSHSLHTAVEVPGMFGQELLEFVKTCAEQFKVPPPPSDFVNSTLLSVSEGRPLVVENIMLLRKNTGSYERALDQFNRSGGDDVRSYVFQREWEAIPRDSRGKEVLACLALYGKPMTFGDIEAVTKIPETKVKDAIGAVQEMFLMSEVDREDTIFSIGSLTKTFLESQIQKLDLFDVLKTRVDNFKRSAYPELPALARLSRELSNAERQARVGNVEPLDDLIWKMKSDRLPTDVKENPRFLTLRGYANSLKPNPNMALVRDDFESAIALGYTPPFDLMQRWFQAEGGSDMAYKATMRVAELVISNRHYLLSEKSEILMMRGIFLYNFAKSTASTDPFRSLDILAESLSSHAEALAGFFRSKSPLLSRSERLAENTAYLLGQRAVVLESSDKFIDVVIGFARAGQVIWDPFIGPLDGFLSAEFRKSGMSKDRLNRMLSKTDALSREISKARFNWDVNRASALEHLNAFRKAAKSNLDRIKTQS